MGRHKICSAIKKMMKEELSPSHTPLLAPSSLSLKASTDCCRSEVTGGMSRVFSSLETVYFCMTVCKSSLLDRRGPYFKHIFFIRVQNCVAVIQNALKSRMIMGRLCKWRSVSAHLADWQKTSGQDSRRICSQGLLVLWQKKKKKISCVLMPIKLGLLGC